MQGNVDPARERDPRSGPVSRVPSRELIVKFKEGPGRFLDEIDGRLVPGRIDLAAFTRTVESLSREAGLPVVARMSFPLFSRRLKVRGDDAVSFPLPRGRIDSPEKVRRHGGTRQRLDLFARVTIPEGAVDIERWRGQIAQDPEVAFVTIASRVSPPQNTAPTPALEQFQGYLDAAPKGIDARYAWRIPGGTGSLPPLSGGGAQQKVRVLLIDEGFRETHKDLPAGIAIVNADQRWREGTTMLEDHGTQSMGILAALKNPAVDFGVTGICHGAELSFGSYWDSSVASFAAVFDQAVASGLEAGDVLVIEAQADHPDPAMANLCLPVERDADVRLAMALAAGQGITVVEPAGNGRAGEATDLVMYTDSESGSLWDESSAYYDDSLAIIVGAGWSPLSGHVPRSRIPESNYGERVDCQGWGDMVATTTLLSKDLVPTETNSDRYYGYFSGTSSATAIVAGAAASFHGALRARASAQGASPSTLAPQALRALLRNPALGSPQQPDLSAATGQIVAGTEPQAYRIGPLPDLSGLLRSQGLFPDVYMRDHLLDTGAVPSPPRHFRSPDIIVRNNLLAGALAAQQAFGAAHWGDEFLGQDAAHGRDNCIYVRMHNRGTTVDDVEVSLYWTHAGMFLHPSAWHAIGSITVPNIGPGEYRVAEAPILWAASDVPPAGSYCLIATLRSPRDPLSMPGFFTQTSDFMGFVRDHNNICFRNVKVVEGIAGRRLSPYYLRLRGVPERREAFRFVIETDLPPGSLLILETARELLRQRMPDDLIGHPIERPSPREALASKDRSLTLEGVILDPTDSIELTLAVELAGDTRPGQYEIRAEQYRGAQRLGRVTYLIRVP